MSVGLLVAGIGLAVSPTATAGLAGPHGGTGSYVLTATEQGLTDAPTFTGNGELGVRVPADGQGSDTGATPIPSELAGFYAEPAGEVHQRATSRPGRPSPSRMVARPSTPAPGRRAHGTSRSI